MAQSLAPIFHSVITWSQRIYILQAWWRHQMEFFFALLALCAGNSPVHGEFPSQMPVTRSFDVFFDLRLNKRLSKHSRRLWFSTPSRSLWRHCNVHVKFVWSCWRLTANTASLPPLMATLEMFFTQSQMSSFWQHFRNWLYRKLSNWQFKVHPRCHFEEIYVTGCIANCVKRTHLCCNLRGSWWRKFHWIDISVSVCMLSAYRDYYHY